ncbi:MAG: GNAT family N-acetyltransferase [Lamprobacter sp.]|uniref:GNAT family N-acetyltransferase n=1 Tax=Lamprobacter sp. TaxID=3100796 RepID=UPI002B264409|nr:GNAT family N-acetyltransferase [Lamprobacter sp.]MEA3639080.1 GNAT family N-acetyltransferase [Lamprobacter sp.]
MQEASTEPSLRIEPLGPHHDRNDFSCGVAPLDAYLRKQARQDAKKRIAAPFVLTKDDSPCIIGFYTLSAISILLGEFPTEITRRLPRYPQIPATLLGRLAIDTRARGEGLGEYLTHGRASSRTSSLKVHRFVRRHRRCTQ